MTAARLPTSASAEQDWELLDIQELSHNPTLFREALALLSEEIARGPATRDFLPIHPETFRRSLRMQRAGIVAVKGGSVQGFLAASADDAMPTALRLNLLNVTMRQRRQVSPPPCWVPCSRSTTVLRDW